MNPVPFFSVIIPVYNAEQNLALTVKSVIEQTYTNWELLLIDDGSDDNSLRIASDLAAGDSRILSLRHEPRLNRGVSATRNLGIKHARGEWIAFLDADDIWHKNKLEEQYGIIKSGTNELVFIYCNSSVIDEKTYALDNISAAQEGVNIKIYGSGKPGFSRRPLRWVIEKGFEAPTSSVAVKRSVVQGKDIYFREYLKYTEDTLFWYEIIQHGDICFIDKSLVGYRVHNTQWNSSATRELKLGRRFLIYSEMLKTGFKKEYHSLISCLLVNKGFRILLVYYLSPGTFSISGIFKYLKELLSGKIKLIYKIFSFAVILTEVVIMPARWIKLSIAKK